MGVAYINVYCAGRTLAFISHSRSAFTKIPPRSTHVVAASFPPKLKIWNTMEFDPSSSSSTSTKALREGLCQNPLLLPKTSKQDRTCVMAAFFLQNRNGCLSWSILLVFPGRPTTTKNWNRKVHERNSAPFETSKWVEALLYGCVFFFKINVA